ncbi:MAG: GbsR/MarR family transcriptional regulator [Methanotrichaceae archaeon]
MNRGDREELKKHIVDACIKVANAKGLSDAAGVLRGTIFLALEPMSMDQLVEETGYSKSTVSANMSLLENLGMVKRIVVPGDKRYYYVPVTDTDCLRTVMLVNLKNEIQLIIDAIDLTERDLKECEPDSKSIRERLSSIRHFYEQTLKLIDLMARHTMDELIELLEKDN